MTFSPYRLFDAVSHQLKKFPKADALTAKVNGEWKGYSTADILDIVDKFSAGLLQLGVNGNDFSVEGSHKIAIISNNRPEWVFTDLAVQQTGAVLTPIYPTTNVAELEFILNDAEVKYVFVSDEALLTKLKSILHKTPSVLGVYTFDRIEGAEHYTKILELATRESLLQLENIKNDIPNTHLATIIYTSGTTGTPKGVMLSHKNIVSCVFLSKESFPFEDAPNAKVLSFLPLNHIFEKLVTYIYLFSGISIYYAESLDSIGDNLREIKPNGFTTVPRLLEKVYERIMSKGQELKGIKRVLFFWSVALVTKYDNNISGGSFYNFKLSIARKLVFNKWREALGGNIEFIITGGAAASEKLLRIFNGAGIPVYEGYGPTESSPVICVNRKEKGGMMIGTVGPPIDGLEVRLAEDGEVLVKGPTVMMGYYKRQDLTEETIVGGWLLTGDIGAWVNNRFLKITDRKKELFKTSGGKYIAPQPIENKLKESRFIEQILIVGPDRKFVGALIVPSFNAIQEWMKGNGKYFTSNEEAIQDEAVLKLFKEIVEKYNQNFNHVEQVKRFELLAKEWSIDTGEMTPKMSLKRKVLMEKYNTAIERIYS